VVWLAAFCFAKCLIEVISLFTELRPSSDGQNMQGERGIYLEVRSKKLFFSPEATLADIASLRIALFWKKGR